MTGDLKTIHSRPRVVGSASWLVVDKPTARAIDDEVEVEAKKVEGKTVRVVADGLTLVSLDRKLTLEQIRAMAEMKPECVICLDAGFANNDLLKTNAALAFKSKGAAKFLTV